MMRIRRSVFITTARFPSLIFQLHDLRLAQVFDERTAGHRAGRNAVAIGDRLALTGRHRNASAPSPLRCSAIAFDGALAWQSARTATPRTFFSSSPRFQIVSSRLMPGLSGGWALATALGFMRSALRPDPDHRLYDPESWRVDRQRARTYAVAMWWRFTVLAASLPLIALFHATYASTCCSA